MKSWIASLRRLVLPFGATTGQRIFLDGDTGVIQIFNASNQLEAEIAPGGVITVYNTSLNPPAYVQLEGSNLWVVSGDETHYFRANATATGATMQVVDGEGTNISGSISSAGVPFFRTEHRINGADLCHLQIDVDQDDANLEYTTTPGGAVIMTQRFMKNVGIMWTELAASAKRMIFWDKSDGYLKSGTYNSSTDTRTTETWQNLTLNNSWVSDGSNTAQYRLDADGSVYIRGRIKDGVSAGGTVFATLPAGYRPGMIHGVGTVNPATLSNQIVAVNTSGTMQIWNVGASNWIDLGGVGPFKVAALG